MPGRTLLAWAGAGYSLRITVSGTHKSISVFLLLVYMFSCLFLGPVRACFPAEYGVAACCRDPELVACVVAKCLGADKTGLSRFRVCWRLAGSKVPPILKLECDLSQELSSDDTDLFGRQNTIVRGREPIVGRNYVICLIADGKLPQYSGLKDGYAIDEASDEILTAVKSILSERRLPFRPPLEVLVSSHHYRRRVLLCLRNLMPGRLKRSDFKVSTLGLDKLPELPVIDASTDLSQFKLMVPLKQGQLLNMLALCRLNQVPDRLLATMPSSVEAPGDSSGLLRALRYVKDGSPDAALLELRRLKSSTGAEGGHIEFVTSLALCQKGELDKACAAYYRSVRTDFDDEGITYEGLKLFIEPYLGLSRMAQIEFEENVKEQPQWAYAYFSYSDFLVRQKRLSAALVVLNRGLKFCGSDGQLLVARARLLSRIGGLENRKRALRDVQAALAIAPDDDDLKDLQDLYRAVIANLERKKNSASKDFNR